MYEFYFARFCDQICGGRRWADAGECEGVDSQLEFYDLIIDRVASLYESIGVLCGYRTGIVAAAARAAGRAPNSRSQAATRSSRGCSPSSSVASCNFFTISGGVFFGRKIAFQV